MGEIYRTKARISERGGKPGFYVVVSRDFVAENSDISTVVCAPVYTEILGIRSEIVIGREDGLPHDSSVRCDFLMLMFKERLTTLVTTLGAVKMKELARALQYALQL